MTTTELPPILPTWLRSRAAFTSTTAGVLHRGAHKTVRHTIWSPFYVAKLLSYSPRGFGRTVAALWRWLFDYEAKHLRGHHAGRLETKETLQVTGMLKEKVHSRLIVLGVLTVPTLIAATVGYFLAPTWALWTVAGGLILALGYVGRPKDKPLAKPTSLVAGYPDKLSAPFVKEALCSLGIAGMRDPDTIGLLFDVSREGDAGYQCDLELPRGVAATAVIEKREQLSAALRRELGTVWPSVGKRHQGHLVLFVSDLPMATAKQRRWPLLKDGKVNIFAPTPFATDQRGSWVDVTLAYTSGVIGAVPRMGKTFYLRELLLLAGLDPRCKVYAVDLKGTGDLSPTALFAHFYSVGDEEDEITEQLRAMRDLRQEMRRRSRVIRGLPHEECPESKVTSELADRKALGLEPVFVGVDECQQWFQNEDKAVREEFISICTDLVKRGPALGIMCYFATQKPSAKSIPTDIADNAVVRIALKVAGQVPNDQVLGTSSYQMGLRATLFSFDDKGVAYLKADGADARIVRSVVGLDAPTAEKVAARARHARQAARRLTGMAAGDVAEHEAEQVDLLEDCRQVVTSLVVHLADLVPLLAALRPALYGHLDSAGLAGMLRAAGVRVDTVWDSTKPREDAAGKGIRAEWLHVSATEVIGDAQDNVLVLTRPSDANRPVSGPVSNGNGHRPA